ncbi:MAG: RNA polymerase factor sigma-54 [Proteobacteria bacterium]|nr:RNA polymerase factor sigma-54 [Pseudomonadota bacterium]
MLELKQTQRLLPVLTQQLQQAIKLLQMSQLELVEAIEQELEENPILEATEQEPAEEQIKEEENTEELFERYTSSEEFVGRDDKEYPDYENIVKKTYNLRDYLRWQIGFSFTDSNERIASEWIIENIDDNGYLVDPIPEISKASGYTTELLESVLKKVQKLDPAGIGARNLRESVFLQYESKGVKDFVFEDIMNVYFDLYPKVNVNEIVKKTGYAPDKIQDVLNKIKEFDPKPGRNFSDDFTSYIVPDVYVIKGEDGFEVYLSDDNIPDLKLNGYYIDIYAAGNVDGETKRYIKKKLKQAEWFIKSLKQRQKTLFNVSKSIVKFQEAFFERGVRFLKPMILKDIALDVGVHESTVSRITTNKYMSTQFGVFELKFFFPTGIYQEEGDQLSTNIIKDLILEYIGKEDKRNPLTDDELVSLLKTERDIKIARRTIAKYREILNIDSSRQRKVEE